MKILVADDDVISRRRIESALRRLGHEVLAVADGEQAAAALFDPQGPRLAILDWMMPGKDGLEVCRAIRARGAPYVYVILLTSRDTPEDMLAGFEAEADDFLTKPFDVLELRARLRAGERVIALQEGLLEAQEALRRQATHDHLTGLWNRAMILDQLGRELHRGERGAQPLAVVLADLDHFKSINDRHGHAAGDAVLCAAAERLRAGLRDCDFVGRYGGEEFLLVLPGCDTTAAVVVAERIRAILAAEPVRAAGVELAVTASLGVAATEATSTSEPDALIHLADEALYVAKAAGRNCTVAAPAAV